MLYSIEDEKALQLEEDFERHQEDLEESLCSSKKEMIELLENRFISKLKSAYGRGWIHRYDNTPSGIKERSSKYSQRFILSNIRNTIRSKSC